MTSVNFEVLFGGRWLAWLTTFNLCANLMFFFQQKKTKTPKIQRSRGGDLFTDFDAEAKEIYGATSVHSGVLSAAVALERELRSGNRSDLSKRTGWEAEKGSICWKRNQKSYKTTNFLGFPYLSFWRIFFYVSSEERTIFYWLLVVIVFFWRVNITRNRWVQWNVTYIFFGCESAWSCLQGVAWGKVVGFSQMLTFTPTPSHISNVHDISAKYTKIDDKISTNYQGTTPQPKCNRHPPGLLEF